ncbi:MAG: hypothetical protein D6714_02950 [Bacteroidetes bacterium]|nr:MAG: hypothetical protein D6714_02950 [Bacteroidota bacterium]
MRFVLFSLKTENTLTIQTISDIWFSRTRPKVKNGFGLPPPAILFVGGCHPNCRISPTPTLQFFQNNAPASAFLLFLAPVSAAPPAIFIA